MRSLLLQTFLITIFLVLTVIAYSQVGLYVKSTGRVGIGTADPLGELDVNGSIRGKGMVLSDTSRSMLILRTIDNSKEVGLAYRNLGGNFNWNIYRSDAGSNAAHLVFAGGPQQTNITDLPERMRITNTGKVGIGTPDPKTLLHVREIGTGFAWAPFSQTTAILERTGGSLLALVSSVDGITSVVMGDTDSQFRGRVRYEHVDDRMEFWTANSERVSILSNGNVGIGFQDPTSKLHVAGSIRMVDGNQAADYVMTSSADGLGSWQDVNSLVRSMQDEDGDTKIQVEENADEDIIRIDLGGTEFFRLDSGRIEVVNSEGSVFLGDQAGTNNVGADRRNTGIGTNALLSNTSGWRNTALGWGAGYDNLTGGYNTCIGFTAGYSNQTGYDNVAVGAYAQYFAGGSRNVSIGGYAGYVAGSDNVFIGFDAGKAENGDNKLYIDNTDTVAPLIYGEFDNNLVRIHGDLEVTGTPPDSRALADADGNTKIQVEESTNDDMIRYDIAGTERMVMKVNGGGHLRIDMPNNQNVLIGQNAGQSINGSNLLNTIVGSLAGASLTSGGSNVMLGHNAGNDNVTGNSNVFIGTSAGRNNLKSSNVFIGRSAGANNNGNLNTMVGYYAGEGNNGTGNVFLGHFAGATASGNNKLYITNSSDTSPLIYGEFDNDLVRVNGDLRVNGYLEVTGHIRDRGGSGLEFITNDSTTRMVIVNSGRVGIGVTNPEAFLHVKGTGNSASFTGGNHSNCGGSLLAIESHNGNTIPQASSVASTNVSIYADGSIVAEGHGVFAAATVNWSDRRIKKDLDISNNQEDLQILKSIEVTDYTRIKDNKKEKKVIAQQVESVYPIAVHQMRGVIPSIFEYASAIEFDSQKKIVTLTTGNPHGLKVADRLDIYTQDSQLSDVAVIGVVSDTAFQVHLNEEPTEVFVYGKYVDDVRSVDYDALSMLNISATQAQQEIIEQQSAAIEMLEKNMKALEEELARVSAMLGDTAQK